MKTFAQLNIKVEQDRIFQVPQITIDEVLNQEIEIIDFEKNITTKFGEGRCIIKLRVKGSEYKLFTDSNRLKNVLEKVNKEDFPFLTTIIIIKLGSGKKTYEFT